MSGIQVGVVGVTGAVGTELLRLFERGMFEVDSVVGFASSRSVGQPFVFRGKNHIVRGLESTCFDGLDYVFFDASDEVSAAWVPIAAKSGARVVDNSAAFRLDPEVPLIVPEVNSKALFNRTVSREHAWKLNVCAGPNCSTVQLVVALKVIDDLFGLTSVFVATYQSVSGAGSKAIEELTLASAASLESKLRKPEIFPHDIAFNAIPRIGGLKASGRTSEEEKVLFESRKILDIPNLPLKCMAVRVPVYRAHSEAVFVATQREVDLDSLRRAYSSSPGILLLDEANQERYPMPRDSAGRDEVFIGRIVRDHEDHRSLSLWVVADNLLKGAALNAVQIARTWRSNS